MAEFIEKTVVYLLLSRNEKEREGYIAPTPIGVGLSCDIGLFTFYYTWALLGLECTHVVPKSYQGLVEKSSRKVALGVLDILLLRLRFPFFIHASFCVANDEFGILTFQIVSDRSVGIVAMTYFFLQH